MYPPDCPASDLYHMSLVSLAWAFPTAAEAHDTAGLAQWPCTGAGSLSQAWRAADLCPLADLPPMLCGYGYPRGFPGSTGKLMS